MASERRKGVTACEVTFFFIGGVLILGGLALVVSRFSQKSATWNFQSRLVFRPDSETVHAWTHPKFPSYMKFYIFNVTNAEEILNGGKPKLTEHGPYTYRMLSPRLDINFYSNETVSYRNNNTLYFDRNLSVGTENDMFFHINIPLVSVSERLQRMKDPATAFMKKSGFFGSALQFLRKEKLIESHAVKEIIFGYDESMLAVIKDLKSLFGQTSDSTFGPFQHFNNSDDGLFLVNTGASNFSNFNVIQRWNGADELSYWSDEYANKINGTDGSFLKPNVRRDETRYFYFTQMRRSVKLEYEADTEFKKIETFRYHFANDLLENASAVPANKGFCVPHCLDSGLLNIGHYGNSTVPMFLSLPHFYLGSQRLQDGVLGLQPNKTKHDSFFHVEPVTGAVLVGQRRIQINVHVTKGDAFEQMKRVNPVFFPYLWVSGEAVASDKVADDLFGALRFVRIMGYSGYVVMAIGLFALTGALICAGVRQKREGGVGDEELLIPGTSSAVDT